MRENDIFNIFINRISTCRIYSHTPVLLCACTQIKLRLLNVLSQSVFQPRLAVCGSTFRAGCDPARPERLERSICGIGIAAQTTLPQNTRTKYQCSKGMCLFYVY